MVATAWNAIVAKITGFLPNLQGKRIKNVVTYDWHIGLTSRYINGAASVTCLRSALKRRIQKELPTGKRWM